MAPFKLKFRMGSSRSTSQDTTDTNSSEHFAGSGGTGGSPATGATHTGNANDAQLQPLLQSHHLEQQQQQHRRQSHHGSHGTLNGSLADSNSTLDSDYASQGSLNGNNDQRILLPGAGNGAAAGAGHHGRSGYSNPTVEENLNEILSNVPQSPPPSYEYVLEENRLANLDKDNNPTHCPSRPRSSASVHVVENGLAACLHHDTLPAAAFHHPEHRKRDLDVDFVFGSMTTPSQEDLLGNIDGDSMFVIENAAADESHPCGNDNDSIKTNTAGSSSAASTLRKRGDSNATTNTTTSAHLTTGACGSGDAGGATSGCTGSGRPHANNNEGSFSDSEIDNYTDTDNDEDDWNSHHEQQYQQQQQQHQQQQQQQQQSADMAQTPDTIINNKSSKEIYKAVAKEWGITCKMSEQCRCMECQSNYFDCEYEENDHHKSDGGLGAGAPMFISEVMHGTACTIL